MPLKPHQPDPKRDGRPYEYEDWTAAERLAYLDGWASIKIATAPVQRMPNGVMRPFFDDGVAEARKDNERMAAVEGA